MSKPTPKSQKQLSTELQNPLLSNPNKGTEKSRANEISFKDDNVKPFSIGFEDIDKAIFYYFENIIKPTISHNGNRIPVPVVYGNQERWKSIQKDGYYRDKDGKIMLPLIIIKRTNIEKNRYAVKLDSNNPNHYYISQKLYSKRNAYDNFSALNNRKPEAEYYSTVMPDYVNITYEGMMVTYYTDQMNKLIETINYASDSYWGEPESFKFKSQIDSFTPIVELNNAEQRIVKSSFSLKIFGYIIPDIIQKDMLANNKFYPKTRITINTETQIPPNLL